MVRPTWGAPSFSDELCRLEWGRSQSVTHGESIACAYCATPSWLIRNSNYFYSDPVGQPGPPQGRIRLGPHVWHPCSILTTAPQKTCQNNLQLNALEAVVMSGGLERNLHTLPPRPRPLDEVRTGLHTFWQENFQDNQKVTGKQTVSTQQNSQTTRA